MEKNKNTQETLGFTRISPEFMNTDNWFKKWREDFMEGFSRISHTLFGYRQDPGRLGMPKLPTALIAQVVATTPVIKKTNEKRSFLG